MPETGRSDTEAAIGISYSVQVGDGRNIVLQTHVPQTAEMPILDGVIDKLRKAADRQVRFGKAEAIEHEIEIKDRLIKQLSDGIAAVDERVTTLQRNGSITNAGGGLHQKAGRKAEMEKEAQQRQNAVVSLKHEMKTREELEQKRNDLLASLG